MTLRERIDAAIAEFRALHPDWSAAIDTTTVAPTTPLHGGAGLSLFIVTRDGIGFEFPLGADDRVADALGAQVH